MFQFEEVVNFAIEDNRGGAIFAGDRLLASRQVDDRESTHPQRNAILHQNALIIRAAMSNDSTHPVERRRRALPGAPRATTEIDDLQCHTFRKHLIYKPSPVSTEAIDFR